MLTSMFNMTMSTTWWTLKNTYNVLYYLVYGDVAAKEKKEQKKILTDIQNTEHDNHDKLEHVEDNLLQIKKNEEVNQEAIKSLKAEIIELKRLLIAKQLQNDSKNKS